MQGSGLCGWDNFPGGITNGAQWYVVKGGLQDFNYLFSNCFEITLELSCCKYPTEKNLKPQWESNKNSLIKYLLKVHQGIKGYVKDKAGNVMPNALVWVDGNEKYIKTTEKGEYWRLLRPGTYKVRATSGQLSSDKETVTITADVVQTLNLILNERDDTRLENKLRI